MVPALLQSQSHLHKARFTFGVRRLKKTGGKNVRNFFMRTSTKKRQAGKKENFFHSLIRMKNYRNLYFNRHNNFHKLLSPSLVFLLHLCLLILCALFSAVCHQFQKGSKKKGKRAYNLKQERKLICLWNDKSSVKYHMGLSKGNQSGGKGKAKEKKVLKNCSN